MNKTLDEQVYLKGRGLCLLNNAPFGNIKTLFTVKRSNAYYDSSREENSGNVRTAVRQRLNPPRPHAGAYPADVWVRYQRMRGHEVNFICADDAHGTPIMLKAQQLGISRSR